jgi:hypothetical protein
VNEDLWHDLSVIDELFKLRNCPEFLLLVATDLFSCVRLPQNAPVYTLLLSTLHCL